jgi:Fe2+ or Zn2+ uptake regulation protein
MTSPPDSQQRLREAGLRVTAPRIAVLEALDAADGHITADQVRQAVLARLGSVSVQTIYDILSALTAAGLVRCLETPGHPARFETRVGDNHHHFICRTCGTTIDIDCAAGEAPCLTPQALPSGFHADEAEVTYWGTCSSCCELAVAPVASPGRERAEDRHEERSATR